MTRLLSHKRNCLNLALFLSLLFVSAAHAATWSVRARPAAQLVNGGPVLFVVKPPMRLKSLTGTWLDHPVTFDFDAKTKTWFALAGVSIETKPGSYALALSAEPSRAGSKSFSFSRRMAVGKAKYPKIKVALNVESKFTAPSTEQIRQIEEAKKVKQDYLNRVTPDREWDGSFTPPVDAPVSDVFGSERIFNDVRSSPHLGLDFRVPGGTPIAAMNDGTVLLARPLFYEGNFVVIDHGQGLLSLYLHLSEFKVKEGDHVKRGEIIGLSGGTGRATGPHLHVAVRWEGTYLDPARLLKMQLP